MNDKVAPTRRSFLEGGMLFAAPLAVAVPGAAIASDVSQARLARLEDEAAIRELNRNWLGQLNGGAPDAAAHYVVDPRKVAFDPAIRGIVANRLDHADQVDIAADGRRAVGRFHCDVEVETPIVQDCTLAKMAVAQGEGVIRRREERMLHVEYVRVGDGWSIAKAALSAA